MKQKRDPIHQMYQTSYLVMQLSYNSINHEILEAPTVVD
jgi:hypothetical protein